MAVTTADLVPDIRVEVGDVGSSIYTDDELTDTYIPAGVRKLNSVWPQEYAIGDDGTFTPDPDGDDYNDRRALTVVSAAVVLQSETLKYQRDAVYHSDVAGSTDLRERARQIQVTINALLDEFQALYQRRVQDQTESSIAFVELRRSLTAHGE